MAVLCTVHACSWFETSSEQAAATFDPAASSATVLKAVSADTPPEILPVKRGELVELPVDKSSQGRLNVLAVGPKGAHRAQKKPSAPG